jgi:hypothetical protein
MYTLYIRGAFKIKCDKWNKNEMVRDRMMFIS